MLVRFERDARFRSRLRAAYGDDGTLHDALLRRARPDAAGTDRTPSPRHELEALRRQLYGSQGGRSDLERYRHAERLVLAQERRLEQAARAVLTPSEAVDPPRAKLPRRSVAPGRIVVLVAAAITAAVVLAVMLPRAGSSPAASPERTPATLSLPATVVRALSAGDPGSASVRAALASAGASSVPALRRPARSAQKYSSATGPALLDIDGLDGFGDMTSISVLIVCDRVDEVELTMTGTEPRTPTENTTVDIDRRRIHCDPSGTATTTGLVYHENPTRLRVDAGVSTAFAVLVWAAG